ncbi:AAA ATPase/RecA recombinase (plasmid) [Leptospira interrogans serovar Linhai str. 56609]|uniref:ATP-binding protein n=1 Tax=Leptospira interrogans TaxID=173 RepID=UPI0002B96C8B|nr:ATP-binding protein [Leptospira interrogans]AJR16724.1 AAA ATPase/RecA recombinase [Leptospira interrogans serovar Linhai str. 56609]EMN38383.1 AAA domain protein [Leptospira interrogans str. L0996]KGE21862.1 ATPase AAA [Leptospira interrogans serovar Lai]
MTFVKATKEQSKLRAAIFGPSGSGKTYSCLSMAQGMGKKIAVIDSERGSSAKYSDRFEFDICQLTDRSIDSYIAMMREAGKLGYDVLIIDSGTHAWQELLEDVDKIAKTKFAGNSYAAWSEGTPKQKKLISALYDFPGHLFFTMRSKTEYVLETNRSGKQAPKRVGLAPEQGKGVEYEFDILIELSIDHYASVSKDRTGKFQDKIIEKPGKEFGEELASWLSEGVAPKPKPEKALAEKEDPSSLGPAQQEQPAPKKLDKSLETKLADTKAWIDGVLGNESLTQKEAIQKLSSCRKRWEGMYQEFSKQNKVALYQEGLTHFDRALGALGHTEEGDLS